MGKMTRPPLNPERGVPGPNRYSIPELIGAEGKTYHINPKRPNFDPTVFDYTKAPGPKYSPDFNKTKKNDGGVM